MAKKNKCICITGESFSEWGRVSIENDILKIKHNAYSCDSDWHEDIKIVFCPFCGNKFINSLPAKG